MKSPYETLQEQLKARFPRIITGDNEVVDEVDSEHTVERLAPLYQLPAWELLKCKIRRQPITDSDLLRSPIPKLPITRSEMTDH